MKIDRSEVSQEFERKKFEERNLYIFIENFSFDCRRFFFFCAEEEDLSSF